jgi:SH3-like domain-containing protein
MGVSRFADKVEPMELIRRVFLLVFVVTFAPLGFALAEPVCVVKPIVNMRKGPGTQHDITWKVAQNMPLMRLSAKGGWSQVRDVDGETHWILSSNVSSRVNCAVIKNKSARLHRIISPKALSAELAYVEKYTPFRKLDRDGAWVLVQDEYKGKYWVHETSIWMPMDRAKITF